MTAIDERPALRLETTTVLDLTRALIQQRSVAGSSGAREVIGLAQKQLESDGVETRLLGARRRPRALVAIVEGAEPGPTLVLNATADTAPIGDPRSWTFAPLGAEVHDGWLYGRGSADSKVGLAIFTAVMRHWHRAQLPRGRLLACFDADEHTGKFDGIQRFVDEYPGIDAVMIGYPGQDALRVGARGFWRASITVFGVGQHSGSRHEARNAIVKATELVYALEAAGRNITYNGLGPQLTVTGIRGGTGFSTVPDSCVVRVDVRLTPEFDADAALRLVRATIHTIDVRFPYDKVTTVRQRRSWPPYELGDDEPVVQALSGAAAEVLGEQLDHLVAGPSNVGNLFAERGVPATCGFGVVYRAIHAPDEGFEIASVDGVLETYVRAVERFMARPITPG